MIERKIIVLFILGVFFIVLGVFSDRILPQPSVGEVLVEQTQPVSATPPITETPNEDVEITEEEQEVKGVEQETTVVQRVIDGDTIKLSDGRSLRYIGIDTAEHPQSKTKFECFARESFEKNKELVEGKTVTLEKDVSESDRFGRLLRYVYAGEVFINDYLVRYGFAYASSYPPDVKYQEQFRQAEQEARENNRGLWNSCKTQD
jgi:micrococcal nuclease